MASFDPRIIGRTYGSVAEEYAASFAEDLGHLPLDREVLDDVARAARWSQPVVDLGCGPGHVAAYLRAAGRAVVGIDVATEMLGVALRRTDVAGCSFVVGDMRRLPLREATCSGAVVFYVLQHIPREGVTAALTEIARVLRPGALLAIAAHLGEGEVASPTEWMGHQVESMAGTLYRANEVEDLLVGAGFSVKQVRYRDPLPHEYQGRRVYVTATRSA